VICTSGIRCVLDAYFLLSALVADQFEQDCYEIVYPSASSGRRADKEPSLTKFFGLDDSLFSTMDHNLHKMRRAALLPYFSPTHVRKLQPLIQERLDVLLERMAGFKDTDEPVNANCMFAAFSNGEAMTTMTNWTMLLLMLIFRIADITQMLAFGQCAKKLGKYHYLERSPARKPHASRGSSMLSRS
jgi:hypothetical protein